MNNIIAIEKLVKKYGEDIVINDISLHVEKGTIYGLLGRNGAGKTTIMKIILGLINSYSGSVTLFGKQLKNNEATIYPRIGSIIETPGFYSNLTGTENLEIFAKLRNLPLERVGEVLKIVNLPYNDKKVFSNYSLGMKQRLGIANAIMHNPELLILDEPTNGLDPIGISEVRDLLKDLTKNQGKTVIISSHILSEIEMIADTIGIIDSGKLLYEDSYENLLNNSDRYIILQIKNNDLPEVERILVEYLNIKDYKVETESTIKILSPDIETSFINRHLILNNIDIVSIQYHEQTLEEYFKKITGGEGIG